jgi:hypothetical protein
MLLWLLSSIGLAQELPPTPPLTETIVVESYKDIIVYVAPIQVIRMTYDTEIESIIDSDAAFTYSGMYWRDAKGLSERNTLLPISLTPRGVQVFNNRTIQYAYLDCDYANNPLGCSYNNGHYYVETTVHVDDNQLVVKAVLYDPDMQVVNVAVKTDDKIITWIKQQEVTNIQQQARDGSQTNVTHYGLEKLPLKWEQHHMLLDHTVQQAIKGLWVGIPLVK